MIAVIWLVLTANLLFITVCGSFITDLQKCCSGCAMYLSFMPSGARMKDWWLPFIRQNEMFSLTWEFNMVWPCVFLSLECAGEHICRMTHFFVTYVSALRANHLSVICLVQHVKIFFHVYHDIFCVTILECDFYFLLLSIFIRSILTY